MSDITDDLIALAEKAKPAKCDRCGGTGMVHGMAEDEWGACSASWPCERGCSASLRARAAA